MQQSTIARLNPSFANVFLCSSLIVLIRKNQASTKSIIICVTAEGTLAGCCVTPPVFKQQNAQRNSRWCGAEGGLAQSHPVSQFQIAASLGLGKETHAYI